MKKFWHSIWRRVVVAGVVSGLVASSVAGCIAGPRAGAAALTGTVAGLLNHYIMGTVLSRVAEEPGRAGAAVFASTLGRMALVTLAAVAVILGCGPFNVIAYLAALAVIQLTAALVTARFRARSQKAAQ